MGEGEIWPPATQKPLNRWSPKFVYVITSGISTTMQNYIQIGLGVSVLRMRDLAPLVTRLLFLSKSVKGDDESQWERGKFDPPPPKNPLTDGHQNLCR